MCELVAVGVHQHVAKSRGLARFQVEKIDINRVAFCNAVLPSASFNNCVTHTETGNASGKSRSNSHRTATLTSGKAIFKPEEDASVWVMACCAGGVAWLASCFGGVPEAKKIGVVMFLIGSCLILLFFAGQR